MNRSRGLLDASRIRFYSQQVNFSQTLSKKKTIATCLAIYLISQILFLINIQFPRTVNFDEFHYVPAAKEMLTLGEDRNPEHPPLAKYIIASGIALWGDKSFGWRFMSAVFGSLTLIAMFLMSLSLFNRYSTALFVTVITLFNHFLYVQSRIAMLDTYMFAFMSWGILFFILTWSTTSPKRKIRRHLLYSGVCFGLAIACKWFAIVPWLVCLGLVLFIRLLQHWKTQFSQPTHPLFEPWYSSKLWSGITPLDLLSSLFAIPVLTYFLTFVPMLFLSGTHYEWSDLFRLQVIAWEKQKLVTDPHPYMSTMSQWPLTLRPMWYAFEHMGTTPQTIRGVFLAGNPAVMWGGLLSLLVCAWGWIRYQHKPAFLILVFYSALYFSWILIPRKVSFYYYYYPAAMILSLGLGYAFSVFTPLKKRMVLRLQWGFAAAVVILFIYFFPILAALRIPADEYQKWMWLKSWI